MTSNAGSKTNNHDSENKAQLHRTEDALPDGGSSGSPDAVVGEEEEEDDNQQRLEEIVRRERRDTGATDQSSFHTAYGSAKDEAEAAQLVEEDTLPPSLEAEAAGSEANSISNPDDTPSVQGSVRSSPSSSVPASRVSSRLGHSPSPQPFERRFKARITSGSPAPRALAPAFLSSHSRQSSASSQLTLRSQEEEKQETEARNPWEVIRWTKLRKISQQAFSESGKRAFGRPTVLCIGASIAVGTSKGIILLFDYQQVLKSIIGQGTPAAECGAVISLAISADHSAVAGGHANGSIFTWDLSRPANPLFHIAPFPRSQQRTSDGHLADSAILHVGFLGQRHTAIVSADDTGMAFSHLARRGLGALGRSVRTTRILGRYPAPSNTPRKPSSVLAFAPLPLGNVEQVTDDFGLTALLTPYLLVIISTTPIAQTQYKSPRLKDIAAHSAMTGCLAWFPAVRLKHGDSATSKTKLVYCWSNVLNVLEIDEKNAEGDRDPQKRAELDFEHKGRWTCDEAILAVQWLSRSIIAVLTITQRLVIIEDRTFRVADTADLNIKHIYHDDLFSRQLQPLVDKIAEGDGSMHGVLPDAYHMSFKAYKGRLFLLGMNDVQMGTLSNWADRLTATLEAGNPIKAVELALSYYTGSTNKVTIGLPDDEDSRHMLVRDKLLELLLGSIEYILNDETNRDTEAGLRAVLQDFIDVAFRACTTIDAADFLFDTIYERYSDASMQDVFLYELEGYVKDSKITSIPPTVFKDLLIWYESLMLGGRLQIMICSLDTSSMDIDQVSEVCRRLHLYDALIYVWNQALEDFVTPLIDLMNLISEVDKEQDPNDTDPTELEAAMKMFPYMAYTLTGRRYPDGEEMGYSQANKARASVYSFVCSANPVRWPPPDGKKIIFSPRDSSLAFPYLSELLHFHPLSILSMLNEAFEDGFLNGDNEGMTNGVHDELFNSSLGRSITRQRIVNILLEVIKPRAFIQEDKILLDIFLARNLAKYPQYILLPGSTLRQVLLELCNNPSPDLADECQLSVEYLLTIHSPVDITELVGLLSKAGYYRVLKSTYRSSRQYSKLLECHFDDTEDQDAVFSCIGDCLRTGSGLNKRQNADVREVLGRRVRDFVDINSRETARVLQMYAPDMIQLALEATDADSSSRYEFMHTLYAEIDTPSAAAREFRRVHLEEHIRLMCQFEPQHVVEYVSTLDTSNLRLNEVLPALETSGVVDATVILLQHDGLAREAMHRLIKHLQTLGTALTGVIQSASPDVDATGETIDDLLQNLGKYVKLGIWLCQGETTRVPSPSTSLRSPQVQQRPKLSLQYTENDLTASERMWLDLVDMAISLHQAVTSTADEVLSDPNEHLATTTLRDLVQTTFSAVLAASVSGLNTAVKQHDTPDGQLRRQTTADSNSSRESQQDMTQTAPRFPPILSTLLTRLSRRSSLDSSASSSILPLLSDLLHTSAFESSILTLARQFLDKDVFGLVAAADHKRRRGWRPAGRGCEGCGRRVWGMGAGLENWKAWEQRRGRKLAIVEKRAKGLGLQGKDGGRYTDGQDVDGAQEQNRGRSKGKGRAWVPGGEPAEEEPRPSDGQHKLDTSRDDSSKSIDAIVVFSCQHIFHRRCLESQQHDPGGGHKTDRDMAGEEKGDKRYICPACN